MNIANVLGTVTAALSKARDLYLVGGEAVDLAKKTKVLFDQSVSLIGKIQAGEQITQAEADKLEAEGEALGDEIDRLEPPRQ